MMNDIDHYFINSINLVIFCLINSMYVSSEMNFVNELSIFARLNSVSELKRSELLRQNPPEFELVFMNRLVT